MQKCVRLEPAYVKKIWGGTWLAEPDASGEPIGEAWVLSTREDHPSIVATGEHAGEAFPAYLEAIGREGWGFNANVRDVFPTLIKFIDAATPLSIQVHPDDSYARAHGMPYGKTEMWVIIAADSDAFLYLGLRENLTPEEFAASLADGSIEHKLNRVPVYPGDVFTIHAGLLHAIGGGVLLAEIQQNSDTTYRVWDFGRVGSDGRPRELHVAQALEVSSLEPPHDIGPREQPVSVPGGTRQLLGQDPCFRTERFILRQQEKLPVTSESFAALIVLNGSATLTLENQSESISAGETWFVPAQEASLHVAPAWDGCTLLQVTVPRA
jgi:mannose-6-phosphate isomerase